MNIPTVGALSHLKVKSTSTRKVIRKSVKLVQKVDYPKCPKHGYTIEYDHSNFFQAMAKLTKW